MHFWEEMPCTQVVRLPSPHLRLLVCGCLAARVCEALWYWVVKEVGQVFSPSKQHRIDGGLQVLSSGTQRSPSSSTMEEVLYGFGVEYDQPPAGRPMTW